MSSRVIFSELKLIGLFPQTVDYIQKTWKFRIQLQRKREQPHGSEMKNTSITV